MVTTYNQKDLVKFGEYLLSEERTNRILSNTKDGEDLRERLQAVYHADIENWKSQNSESKQAIEDLDHWCAYSGIDEDNKKELFNLIESIIRK